MNNKDGIYRDLRVNQGDLEFIRDAILDEECFYIDNGHTIPKRLLEFYTEVHRLIKDIEDSKTRYWLKYKGEANLYFEKFDIIDGFVEFKDCEDRWEMTFDEVCEAIEKYKINIDNFELMKVKREKSDYEAGMQENL